MSRTLLVAARVLATSAGPDARAVLLEDDRIAWVGAEPAGAPPHDEEVDLGGAWLTPGFCDAHVHATASGLATTGLDLSTAGTATEVCERLRAFAAEAPGGPILGSGWDERDWAGEPPPDAEDLAAAGGGRMVHLSRVDGHSCLVDSATLAALPVADLEGVDRDAHGRPTGWLREQASEAAWVHVRDHLPSARLEAARRSFAALALARGVTAVHEMGHPGLSSLEDAQAWARDGRGLDVAVWWADPDATVALDEGLRPGGDLFVDGSLGSGTAAVSRPYRDGGHGVLLLDVDAVTALLVDATRAGATAGVHAIGDRALDVACEALRATAGRLGAAEVRACRHRIEHCELAGARHVATFAELGTVASVQPAFDARWGGPDGRYAQILDPERARGANPLRCFAEAGVAMAFGSDTPVTPLDPWATIAAACRHRGGWGVDWRRAVHAHTVQAHLTAGRARVGDLRPGWRADLAVWDADPRADDGLCTPSCLATLTHGRAVHGLAGVLDGDPPRDSNRRP